MYTLKSFITEFTLHCEALLIFMSADSLLVYTAVKYTPVLRHTRDRALSSRSGTGFCFDYYFYYFKSDFLWKYY